MISKMFLQAVKLCLSASIVTGLVLLLRFAFKKAPKSLVCALWILVGLRLVIPAMPASKVSVIPEAVSGGTAVEALEKQYVEKTTVIREDQNEELYKQITALYTDLPVYREAGTSYVVVAAPAAQATVPATAQSIASTVDQSAAQSVVPADSSATQPAASAAAAYTPPKTFGDSVVPALSVVWVVGVGIMLLYMAASYWRLHRRLRTAVIREKGVWESDQISSPFILGIIRPRIYLPISLSEEEREFVLAHEKTHLKRGDQIWKPLGYLFLAVYWFNPLFWLAYFLLCRDIESACDERVIRSEGTAYRKAYSETLLKLNVRQNAVTACPLAFAENGVGGRIRRVLNYKKPAFWVIAAALIIGVVAAGCALTDPTKKESPAAESTEQTESEASTEESTESESTAPESTAADETQRGGHGLEAGEKLTESFFRSSQDVLVWPDDFGGMYWEENQNGFEMILCLKDPDEAMIKRYMARVAGYEDSVHIKAVKHSMNELNKMLSEIVEEVLAPMGGCYQYGVNCEINGLGVAVEESSVEKVRSVLQQKYPDVQITVEIAQQYPVRPQTTFEILYTDEKALDANTREKLVSFIGNDYKPLPWAFLRQDFRDPSEIDVIDLFYNWTEELSGEAEQEAAWKAGHMEELRLETQKRTAKGMNEVFRKYTGKELTKEQTDAFSTWIYLPEYDAYYSFLTDMMPQGAELGRACYLGEKDAADLGLKAEYEQLIALEWYTLIEGTTDDTGMLLLVPVEDSWQIVANLFYKEPEAAPVERTECTTKVLEGSIDEKTGVTYFLASDGAYQAPNDFAVISESDIVILDSVSSRLQRFKDGQYFDTVNLPGNLGEYYELCVIGDSAYVLANGSLVKVDLNTKELSTITLPNPEKETANYMGLYVNDMLEQDGKLYLVTELYGNFCLNEETQEVVKTESAKMPYRSWRNGGVNGKEILVEKGDRRWTINAPNRYGDVIGFGEDGIVYFYLEDANLTREDEGYCRILKCEAGKGVIAESIVDVSKWILSTQNTFAKLGADGSVYVLALHEDDFAVYKLNVGVEDIREQ